MAQHALLSASSSERWLACTPSARAEEHEPDTTSPFAEQGTFAHTVGEWCLARNRDAADFLLHGPNDQANSPWYDAELIDYVDGYLAFCRDQARAARERSADAVILIEHRIDYSYLVPEGFGTGDYCTISDGVLTITDLKYGKGKRVEVKSNSQMRLYALGLYNEFSLLYRIDRIEMTVYQPRIDNIATETISADDLVAWGEEYVRPRAALAWNGEGVHVPGDHCRFCRVRFTCRARAEHNIHLARQMFKQAHDQFTLEEIGELLPHMDAWMGWAQDVKHYALRQAVTGREVPGYKLVAGRSNRYFSDTDKVEAALAKVFTDNGCDPDKTFWRAPELMPLTTIEKTLGRKKFEEVLGGLVSKQPGKPVLVCASDPRTALAINDPHEFFKGEPDGISRNESDDG
jgi:hypothetical protein